MKKMNYKKNSVLLFIPILIVLILTGCEKEVSRTPVEPEPEEGVLYVDSDPAGFHIYLDERNSGSRTPDSLIYLDYGTHKVTLKKTYFKDTSVVVQISEEEKTDLFVNYIANPSMFGDAFISSNPEGASIYLNDSLLENKTPYTIEHLLPGEYDVRLELYNHRDGFIDVIIRSSDVSDYGFGLRDTSVWVDYNISNSGIQSNSYSSIVVDNSNVKWIGSIDAGVIRYDGSTFTNYSTENSGMPHNTVNDIAISPDNKIWAATQSGIGVFDGGMWTAYTTDNSGLKSNFTHSIDFDNAGNAWVGADSGLYKFDGIIWQEFTVDTLQFSVLSTKVVDDGIWVGTKLWGIWKLVNNQLIHYPDSIYNFPSKEIKDIEVDNMGNPWFCHSLDTTFGSGVTYFNGNSFTSLSMGVPDTEVNDIFIDQFNNKWVSTYQGLVIFDENNSREVISALFSLMSSNRLTSSAMDKDTLMWITTTGGGLNKYKWNR